MLDNEFLDSAPKMQSMKEKLTGTYYNEKLMGGGGKRMLFKRHS